jgi:threonine synthase
MAMGVLTQYRDRLPVTEKTPLISLGEGATPLVSSRNLCNQLGCGELFFKLEGCNPTGSFKDRGMVVAMAKAMEAGSKAVICASTGNTSASAAAYGAYCGLTTYVVVPDGEISKGKLAQAIAYGAQIIAVNGSFDIALDIVRKLADDLPVVVVNSVNPYRIQGQKTAAFEIVDHLGKAPDELYLPVGNAGNISAYWSGFKEYHDGRLAETLPKMMGYQATGAAPIVDGARVESPQTIASAIRIGNPASWSQAITARDESNGTIDKVTDEEILEAYSLLANSEGIFCEPASAASLAGLMKQVRMGRDLSEVSVVCVLTGNGLKDTELAVQVVRPNIREVSANYEDVVAVVAGQMAIS